MRVLNITLLAAALVAPMIGSGVAAQAAKPASYSANTIVDVAIKAGSFKTLVKAVQAAGLVETLQGNGPFTVFAPTDEAFAKLPKGTLEALIADPAKLKAILTYHVVAGKVMAEQVVGLKSATTVNGQDVGIRVENGKVYVDGAQVTATDIPASNGVIHVIDAVILPPELKLFSLLLALAAAQDTTSVLVRSVEGVDLARYAGRWHEVARFPNRFQTKCVAEITADYALLSNGQVRVVNTCRQADGRMSRAEGRARLTRRDGPSSQLKVRFAPGFLSFLSMVWGNYWILDLTEDYGAALVGDPRREYLWVLSRTPELDDDTYRRLVATAEAQGFEVARLVRSPNQASAPPPGSASPP